jgi:tRNA threonylcarbamoyladenosine biosynthesis protein TsaB
MELFIDTTQTDQLFLALVDKGKILASFHRSLHTLSENLLPEIATFLQKHKLSLGDLTGVVVNPGPGAFSATRTGVATANALAFALGVKVRESPSGRTRDLVLPKYDQQPHITQPKNQ